MKSKYFFYFAFLMLFAFQPFMVFAGTITEQEAENFAREQGEALLKNFAEEELEVKYQKLDAMFLKYVDLNHIGKFVIGKYWRVMDESQREKYTELFKRYVLGTYKGFPLNFDDKVRFEVVGSRSDGKYMSVDVDISYKKNKNADAANVKIEFLMHKPQEKIMFTDIKVGESSLLNSYRGKFYEMVKSADEDMDWFLEDLELTVTSIEKHYALPED